MWRRARERGARVRGTAAESELIEECEAFLSGRFREHLVHQNRAVPNWAWLNVLAHGDSDQILSPTDNDHGRSPWEQAWCQALAYLAAEMRTSVEAMGCSLGELQRSALVPLELEVLAKDAQEPLDPGQLARIVVDALDRYRASQRR
jgi:hypothetical protein